MIPKILLVISIVVSFSACTNKKAGFTIKAPQGWVLRDTLNEINEREVIMRMPAQSSTPQFVENIIVNIEHSRFVDLYMNGVLLNVKKDAVYFKTKGAGTFMLNNYEVKWEQHNVEYKKYPGRFEQKVFFIGDAGNIYMIICTSQLNEMDKLKESIDEVLTSFKIT
jgi:hypothetical protein